MHDDEPAQDETVPVLPHAGHAVKQKHDKKGQIGDLDHDGQLRKWGSDATEVKIDGVDPYKCHISS